jgi:4'-phosphopantetheinyl transferase
MLFFLEKLRNGKYNILQYSTCKFRGSFPMDIYLLPLPDGMEESRERLLACIDAEKRYRLLRLRQPDDVDRSLLADIFIRDAAIRRFGLRNEHIHFGIGSMGKPYLSLASPFHFNCSHSGRFILCVVSDDTVGCDIEKIQEADEDVAALVFSREERQLLREANRQERRLLFYRLWTRKESFIKATGAGLSDSLHTFSVIDDMINGTDIWFIRSYEGIADYQIAVCGKRNAFPDEIQRIDTVKLLRTFLETL